MADNDNKNKSEDVKKENGATTQVASSPQSTYAQGGRRKGRFFARKKVCPFTVDPTLVIDYKDYEFLCRFIDDSGATTDSSVNSAGRVFNIVSGSIADGVFASGSA